MNINQGSIEAKKSYNAEDCLETAVSLLAACYLELDCIENSGQVLEILDRAGNFNASNVLA